MSNTNKKPYIVDDLRGLHYKGKFYDLNDEVELDDAMAKSIGEVCKLKPKGNNTPAGSSAEKNKTGA